FQALVEDVRLVDFELYRFVLRPDKVDHHVPLVLESVGDQQHLPAFDAPENGLRQILHATGDENQLDVLRDHDRFGDGDLDRLSFQFLGGGQVQHFAVDGGIIAYDQE